jgi:hypothetical protein
LILKLIHARHAYKPPLVTAEAELRCQMSKIGRSI